VELTSQRACFLGPRGAGRDIVHGAVHGDVGRAALAVKTGELLQREHLAWVSCRVKGIMRQLGQVAAVARADLFIQELHQVQSSWAISPRVMGPAG
jgi:hypothetical protein